MVIYIIHVVSVATKEFKCFISSIRSGLLNFHFPTKTDEFMHEINPAGFNDFKVATFAAEIWKRILIKFFLNSQIDLLKSKPNVGFLI